MWEAMAVTTNDVTAANPPLLFRLAEKMKWSEEGKKIAPACHQDGGRI